MKSKAKKKLITIPKLKAKVQKEFNRFIRERDKGHDCISCGNPIEEGEGQAGHFFGVKKFNWMRFREDNVHLECISCNAFNHESLIYYTINIERKIGPKRFQYLVNASRNKQPEFTREELNELLIKYGQMGKTKGNV